jgi:hypothetical protein
MLHGTEAVVPQEKAGWLWGPMMQAISSGKPPEFVPHQESGSGMPLPSASTAGLRPTGGSVPLGGGAGVAVQIGDVHVHVPPGTPTQVANQIGTLTEQAVYNAMQKVSRQMRGGARNYGFMPS